MDFLRDLVSPSLWQSFLDEKEQDPYADKRELAYLRKLVAQQRFLSFGDWIANQEYKVTPIHKKELIVSGKDKRRIVYCYQGKELDYQYLFKFLNYRLREYDDLLPPNLYSFRASRKIGGIVAKLQKGNYLKTYKAKLDIHDYFRSISLDLLLPLLQEKVPSPELVSFVGDYLRRDEFLYRGKNIHEAAGVFPGNPISGFLSNLFLAELDSRFLEGDVSYFRYADDILVCAPSEEKLQNAVTEIEAFLAEKGLAINPKKKEFFLPGEPYHFLGLAFSSSGVSISNETIVKITGKIRRSARKIRRWCLRKRANPLIGVKILIQKYDAKFFGIVPGEQSWLHWYFPYIRNDVVLRYVDRYFYQEARYIMTGKHGKLGYKALPYSKLQELGYRSLVREFHRQLEEAKKD